MGELILLTQMEMDKFSQIYNDNYLEKTTKSSSTVSSGSTTEFNESPSLLKGVPLIQLQGVGVLQSIDINTIVNFDEKFNDGSEVFTTEFMDHIREMDKIIKNSNLSSEAKYALFGKLFNSGKCNNDFNQRFIKFILQYVKLISHNKSILLSNMRDLLTSSISEVGNCDYTNWEGISNKQVEDAIRSGEILRMPADAILTVADSVSRNATSAFNSFNNLVSSATAFKERPEQIEIDDIDTGVVSEIQKIRELVSLVRTEIMAMKDFEKNNFCSKLEIVNTVKKYPDSAFWLRTPGLVALTTSAVNISAAFSLHSIKAATSAASSHLQTEALRIASIVNTACGPLLGLIIGLSVGTLLESKFYKDLRNSRMIYLSFQKFLATNNYKAFSPCSYRNNATEYKNKFETAKERIDEYFSNTKTYYDDEITNLDFYFFIYDYFCKTKSVSISEPMIVEEPPVIKTEEELNEEKKYLGIIEKIRSCMSQLMSENDTSNSDSIKYYEEFLSKTFEDKVTILKSKSIESESDIKCARVDLNKKFAMSLGGKRSKRRLRKRKYNSRRR